MSQIEAVPEQEQRIARYRAALAAVNLDDAPALAAARAGAGVSLLEALVVENALRGEHMGAALARLTADHDRLVQQQARLDAQLAGRADEAQQLAAQLAGLAGRADQGDAVTAALATRLATGEAALQRLDERVAQLERAPRTSAEVAALRTELDALKHELTELATSFRKANPDVWFP